MSTAEIVALINAVMAFLSFCAIQWSVPKVGKPLNYILIGVSAFALFFSGAYLWLLFNIGQGVGWGVVMRIVTITVWPIVWMAPSVAAALYVKKSTILVKHLTDELAKKVEETRLEYH